jgi:hypothetical protein
MLLAYMLLAYMLLAGMAMLLAVWIKELTI